MEDWLDLPFDEIPIEDVPARPPRPISVSELSARLKSTVERTFSGLVVEGEQVAVQAAGARTPPLLPGVTPSGPGA